MKLTERKIKFDVSKFVAAGGRIKLGLVQDWLFNVYPEEEGKRGFAIWVYKKTYDKAIEEVETKVRGHGIKKATIQLCKED